MKEWVMVTANGFEEDDDFKTWVQQGGKFALTLPEKQDSNFEKIRYNAW